MAFIDDDDDDDDDVDGVWMATKVTRVTMVSKSTKTITKCKLLDYQLTIHSVNSSTV